MIACLIGVLAYHGGVVPAMGHAILVNRGSVVAHPDRVSTEIEVSAEDFFHHYRLRVDDNAVATADLRNAIDRHKAYLTERFSIRDEAGDRLDGRISEVRFELPKSARIDFLGLRKILVTYAIEFPTHQATRFLTFQQRFGDASTAMPSQLVLSVRSADSESGRMIVLTSGGNFETVELRSRSAFQASTTNTTPVAFGKADTDSASGADRFKEICAIVKREGAECTIDIHVPLTVLESFTPIARTNADYLEPAEIVSLTASLRSYFSNKPPVAFLSGSHDEDLASTVDRVALLAPGEYHIEDVPTNPRRLGAWSARIAVRIRCKAEIATAIDWRFLNSGVMNATIQQIVDGKPCRVEAVFTGDTRVTLKKSGRP